MLSVLLSLSPSVAQAKELFCVRLEERLDGKIFAAKVPLYDTEIGYDMIFHLERDGEEIGEGEEFTVVDVDCGRKAIEMTLKPQRKGDKVEIKFFLSRSERAESDSKERLEHMMDHVFESLEKDD